MNDEEPMRPSDTHTDEPTLDDLLWELDVTTARPARQETTAPAHPEPVTPRRERVSTASNAAKPPKAPKRGRFHRPELESRWERVSRNRVVQAVSGVVLLGGTAALVVVALGR